MLVIEHINLLTTLFFFVAILYSTVGFGGGSSYIALLILMGVSHNLAPSMALICNIIVVIGGTLHFLNKGTLSWKFISPFLFLSVPLAYVGGLISINKDVYQFILAIALFLAASRMLFLKNASFQEKEHNKGPSKLLAMSIGGGLGFVSGLVGIGGGIFLAPIMYLCKWGSPKIIAATSSVFILINSIAGLVGQVQKTNGIENLTPYLQLFVSVFLGGQIGSWLCNNRISYRKIEVLTSLLILFVSIRLFSNVLII
ncbi:MAG: sulfite exporter TauE/SafE family protein [Bacteriovoracaceae bacterium]|jgi:uncharacterized protein|nr:sulfite exporter TauE/SafE family protein [Bacteriovoracaceae bacterium]